jgi:hypothetical protein
MNGNCKAVLIFLQLCVPAGTFCLDMPLHQLVSVERFLKQI